MAKTAKTSDANFEQQKPPARSEPTSSDCSGMSGPHSTVRVPSPWPRVLIPKAVHGSRTLCCKFDTILGSLRHRPRPLVPLIERVMRHNALNFHSSRKVTQRSNVDIRPQSSTWQLHAGHALPCDRTTLSDSSACSSGTASGKGHGMQCTEVPLIAQVPKEEDYSEAIWSYSVFIHQNGVLFRSILAKTMAAASKTAQYQQ